MEQKILEKVAIEEEKALIEVVPPEVENLFLDYQKSKSKHLRNKIALKNQPLVTYIVNKYYSSKIQHQILKEDLLQEGCIGLMSAVDGFDPGRGFKFSTYACVPLDTEILTKRGWKKYNELVDGDETIGYNNGVSEWTKINGVKTYQDAPLVKFGDSKWSAICTDQHKWLISENDKVELKPLTEWKPNSGMQLITSTILDGKVSSDLIEGDPRLVEFVNGNTIEPEKTEHFTVTPCGIGSVWCPNTDLGSWTARGGDGMNFLTGNTWWIRQAVNNYLLNIEPTIHVPPHVKTAHNKLVKKLKEENTELKELIADVSRSQNFELTNNMLQNINMAINSKLIRSMEEEVSHGNEGGNVYLKDLIESNVQSQEIKFDRTKVINFMFKAFTELSNKEKLILLLRFDVINDMEAKELCQKWNTSKNHAEG